MSRQDQTRQAKLLKRQKLEDAQINPHPYSFNKTHPIGRLASEVGKTISTAGRISSIRTHGQLTFIDLNDFSGQIQILIHKSELDKSSRESLEFSDQGDFLGVVGKVGHSKTNQLSLVAHKIEFLGKSLLPLPSVWNAAENKEVRFRKRYLDIIVNPDTKRVLDARWQILKEIRRFLQDQHDFIEVETPILQPLYGGTNAAPFTTHMNSLDSYFYLRLAPELYLKRLIAAGYDKVFEIARNFRNEGIDQTHQPEFTMIEWYESYADYHKMMDTAEDLIKHLVKKLYSGSKLSVAGNEIDISGKWPRITMIDALKQYANLDFNSLSEKQIADLYHQYQIEKPGVYSSGRALFEFFDKLVTPKLIQPTWIIDYPKEVSPLAKTHRSDSNLVERFEAYIGTKEIADGWSEITDPLDQRQRFENEQKNLRSGDSEAHPVDEEFLEAMEYGFPPLGGIGIGIDRLVMFLTNTWSIKEVIAFPTLRPLRPIQQTKIPQDSAGDESQESQILSLPDQEVSQKLLESEIKNPALRRHCQMVALAMAAYAKQLKQDENLWYQTGLLHDLDWESHPDEHPLYATKHLLNDYPASLIQAIKAHAPDRTNTKPASQLDRYLFACDEISGFLNAISLMRPNGFADMNSKSVIKKLKDKSFASNVSRSDIDQGLELIGKTKEEHFDFLIQVFREKL